VSVSRWQWRDETIHDLPALHTLAGENLQSTVLRLSFDIDVDLRERDEIQRIVDDLMGNEAKHARAGVLDADLAGIRIRITSLAGAFPPNLPPVIQTVVDKLQGIAAGADPNQARRARIALYKLSTLTQPRSSP
jgi:hypothetical protein